MICRLAFGVAEKAKPLGFASPQCSEIIHTNDTKAIRLLYNISKS